MKISVAFFFPSINIEKIRQNQTKMICKIQSYFKQSYLLALYYFIDNDYDYFDVYIYIFFFFQSYNLNCQNCLIYYDDDI